MRARDDGVLGADGHATGLDDHEQDRQQHEQARAVAPTRLRRRTSALVLLAEGRPPRRRPRRCPARRPARPFSSVGIITDADDRTDHDHGREAPLHEEVAPLMAVAGEVDARREHHHAGPGSRASARSSTRCGEAAAARAAGPSPRREDDRVGERDAEGDHHGHDVQGHHEFVGGCGGGDEHGRPRSGGRSGRRRPASHRTPRPANSGPSAPGGSRGGGCRSRGRSHAAPRGGAPPAPGRARP